jgi:Flp pilus assembly protein TadB
VTEILLFSGLLLSGLAIIAFAWRNARARAMSRQRMEGSGEASAVPGAERRGAPRTFPVRYRLLPWMLGFSAAVLMYFVFGWGVAFVITVGLLFSLLGGQLESHLAARSMARIETQLADAIDLMVGALGAGAGVTDALENATRESQRPLRPQLDDVIGRIRLGDDPPTVYRNLTERVPLETFLLFSSALSVHWETGGSLAPTLASVGRTIRDRIEIARRIHSNAAQSQMSTVAVMLLTYFIAVVMWRTNPEQMMKFLATSGGQWAVAGTIVLQAIGLVWMSWVSRLRF